MRNCQNRTGLTCVDFRVHGVEISISEGLCVACGSWGNSFGWSNCVGGSVSWGTSWLTFVECTCVGPSEAHTSRACVASASQQGMQTCKFLSGHSQWWPVSVGCATAGILCGICCTVGPFYWLLGPIVLHIVVAAICGTCGAPGTCMSSSIHCGSHRYGKQVEHLLLYQFCIIWE